MSQDGSRVVIRDGLIKTIKKQGEGTSTPAVDDLAYVHYVGKLEDGTALSVLACADTPLAHCCTCVSIGVAGTVFDSTRVADRRAFQFNVGMGKVILGWDLGVATMRLNELAVLEVSPEYGYGSRGVGPIPPNAKLTFEIELLHFEKDERKPLSNLTVAAFVLVPLLLYYLIYGFDGVMASWED